MGRFALLILAGLLIGSNSKAQEYVVVKKSKDSMILKANDRDSLDLLSVGEKVSVKFDDDTACELPIKKIKGEKLLVSTESCSKIVHLLEGKLIGSKPIRTVASEEGEKVDEHKSSGWKFALGLGYMLNSAGGTFSEVTLSSAGGSASGEMTLNLDNGPSLFIEARNMEPLAWGFSGGLNYEFARKLKSGTVKFPGLTVQMGDFGGDSLSVATLYGNAVYRWTKFYLPFGINYSSVKYNLNSGTDKPNVTGAMGAQIGVGWFAAKNVSVEAYSWVTAADFGSQSDNGTTLNFGKGSFGNLILTGKYEF